MLAALFEGHDLVYLVWLGLPLLFLFVLSPGLALVAIPQLLANGLSDFRSMTDPRYHSVAAVIPFLIAATVFGVARVRPPRRVLAAAGVLICSAVLAWRSPPGAGPSARRRSVDARASRVRRVAALTAAVASVPDDAAVVASNTAGAHLSARRYVYSVPNLGRASWAVVDLGDPVDREPRFAHPHPHPELVRAFVARLERDPAWSKVSEREGVLVFRRLSGVSSVARPDDEVISSSR